MFLWSPKILWIEEAIQSLQGRGMSLEVEDSVAGFLRSAYRKIPIKWIHKLAQVGLIKRIIAALGIEHMHAVHTPTGLTPLTKDSEGGPFDGSTAMPVLSGFWAICKAIVALTSPTLSVKRLDLLTIQEVHIVDWNT
jgi:hypothetical protein